MRKAIVYNQEGKKVGEVKLEPKIFEVSINPEVVQQAAVTQLANARKVLAHTKDRSEVRGGGAKPWRQKGTGRARHGSIRSPIWIGGGVTFGPRKERNFKKRMNKKAKRKALFMVLSDRAQEAKIIILDELKLPQIKTRALVEILNKLPLKNRKTLLILPGNDQVVVKSCRNLPQAKTSLADNLNILEVLEAEYLLLIKDSLKKIKETYLSKRNLFK